ncbi:MAG: hypothetical protein AAB092_08095 [Chloroflexota bacterium]
MAWLKSLRKKNDDAAVAVAEEEEEEEPAPALPTGPQLAVLVPDIAGISSFRLRTLPDSPSAAEHIGSLKADVRQETHAFWALHDKPIVDESTHVEALVLIRAQTDSDLVYVVSFLDIESALSFTRFEVRRGLYLGNVMIYWAAFAQLREELEGISVTPEFAPPTENYVLPVAPREETRAPEPVASIAVAEPEVELEPMAGPELGAPVETEALHAFEEHLRNTANKPKRRIIEPVAEQVAAVELPVIDDQPIVNPIAEKIMAAETAAITALDLPNDDEDLGQLWPDANADIEEAEPAAELTSPVAEEQAAIQEAFVFQHKTMEFRPLAHPATLETGGEENGLLVDHEPVQIATFGTDRKVVEVLAARLGIGEPEPGIETIAGDEEAEFMPMGSADPAAGFTTTPKLDDFDVALEVERLLRGRKWEQRNGPFSGFQSPPGRF